MRMLAGAPVDVTVTRSVQKLDARESVEHCERTATSVGYRTMPSAPRPTPAASDDDE
jgi:hypothetical protein